MLIVLERERLELREEVEHSSEKQEVLATLMEGKTSLQKVALDTCSSSLAFDTDEVMSASSKMAHDADEAMSESSWTALAKEKKLEVVGPWSGPEGGSVDPMRKMGLEERETPKEVVMEMDDDEPQEESVDIQSPKRKVIRVESEETQYYVREILAISQETKERKWASWQAPLMNHEGPFIGATIDVVKKPSESGKQLQWLLKKVVKLTQSNSLSSATMKSWCSRANSH